MIPEEIIQEFHERPFGEELARVNFLPKEDRWAYVRSLWQRAHIRAQRGDRLKTLHGAERIWDAAPDPAESFGCKDAPTTEPLKLAELKVNGTVCSGPKRLSKYGELLESRDHPAPFQFLIHLHL